MKVYVPPIKSQGIKTKLVPWIKAVIPSRFNGTILEPFMGTGVVSFNLVKQSAMLFDINPHLINFYEAINRKIITPEKVRAYLEIEGLKLEKLGEKHYYYIRDRFNTEKSPLDFLFINRAGFNGMIRFNRKGSANVPFCRKPQRFARPYVTKIVNQVKYLYSKFQLNKFHFECRDFESSILEASSNDLIYCDPPYIGRHVDYFSGWSEEQEFRLHSLLSRTEARFILSTWHSNEYRRNEYINSIWSGFNIITREHYYHVGGKEENRNPVIEALITNFETGAISQIDQRIEEEEMQDEPTVQMALF